MAEGAGICSPQLFGCAGLRLQGSVSRFMNCDSGRVGVNLPAACLNLHASPTDCLVAMLTAQAALRIKKLPGLLDLARSMRVNPYNT